MSILLFIDVYTGLTHTQGILKYISSGFKQQYCKQLQIVSLVSV